MEDMMDGVTKKGDLESAEGQKGKRNSKSGTASKHKEADMLE